MAKQENSTVAHLSAVPQNNDEAVNPMAKRSYKDFDPLLGYILVTIPEEHLTKNGIVLLEGTETTDFQDLNVVVAVSDTAKIVEIGDGVYVGNGSITTLTFKEGKFGVLRENQLMGRVKAQR